MGNQLTRADVTYHQRFKTAKQRFSEKYRVAVCGCWVWGGVDREYPKFWNGERYIRASRYALSEKLGRELRDGEEACHSCDNVRCVNPDHLFVGSHSDNMSDRHAKGRNKPVVGENNPNAKLSRSDVESILELRRLGESQQAIADHFGVSQTQVSRIVRGHSWSGNAALPT